MGSCAVRLLWCFVVAACYSPTPRPGAPCGDNGACPSALVCSPATQTCEPTAVDATVADAPHDAMVDASLGTFSTPVLIAELSSADDEDDLTLTADELEMYFESNRVGTAGAADIYRTTRASIVDAWSAPERVDELNTQNADSSPEIARDGLSIYLCSNRMGSATWDLFIATRPDRASPWSAPVRVTELSSPEIDCAAVEREDRLEVILHRGTEPRDLVRATRGSPNDPWQVAGAIAELNTARDEGSPFLARGDLALLYNRDGDNMPGDLWIATRAGLDQPFEPGVAIPNVNSTANDADPWLSPDGRRLYFASTRAGGFDLYVAER